MTAVSKLGRPLCHGVRVVLSRPCTLTQHLPMQQLENWSPLPSSSGLSLNLQAVDRCPTLVQKRYLHKDDIRTKDPESGLPIIHPKKGLLVYTGSLSSNLTRVKMVSMSTSMISVFVQPFVISAAKDDMMMKAGILGTISTLVFCTPALLHFVAKKYITDIYYNEDTKVFTLARKTFFLRRKEVEYKAEDVKIPFHGGFLVNHVIKGTNYFIDVASFRSKDIYKHMVGYDSPMTEEIKILSSDVTAPKKEMSKKKFGLFEDEDETVKNQHLEPDANKKIALMRDEPQKTRVQTAMPPKPSMLGNPVLLDDDDDDCGTTKAAEKQKTKIKQ